MFEIPQSLKIERDYQKLSMINVIGTSKSNLIQTKNQDYTSTGPIQIISPAKNRKTKRFNSSGNQKTRFVDDALKQTSKSY